MSKPTPETKAIHLTQRERQLILRALQIALEDGSLYGTAETAKAISTINGEVEAIEAKLS